MELTKTTGEFFQYQATVNEEGIIAKIMRELEDRSKGSRIPFEHISLEDNWNLDMYELIHFFKPFTTQTVSIAIPMDRPDPMRDSGEVLGVVATKPRLGIRYRKIGQAQLWYSTRTKQCILWECIVWKPQREGEALLKAAWDWLIAYIKHLEMKEIYTHNFDPAYEEIDYPTFLASLGFRETETERVLKMEAES